MERSIARGKGPFDSCTPLDQDEASLGFTGDLIGRRTCPYGIANPNSRCNKQKCNLDGDAPAEEIVCNVSQFKNNGRGIEAAMCWTDEHRAFCDEKAETDGQAEEDTSALTFDQN